jgi:hypothetical protein
MAVQHGFKGDMDMSAKQTKAIINDAIIKEIRDSIQGIDYGAVTITLHDARIVQIEVSKKSRFDAIWTVQEGGGI